MKEKLQKYTNTLRTKILCTVIIGSCCLSIGLDVLNTSISKEVFVNSFAESQKKIFTRIDREFYDFFEAITEIITRVDTSWAIRQYLTVENKNTNDEMKTIFYLKRHLKETELDNYSSLSVWIVGKNGKNHLTNDARSCLTGKRMLKESVAQKAIKSPGTLVCEYVEHGYTDDTKNEPVVVMARTINYKETDSYDGVIFFMIKDAEFKKMYSYFTSDNNDIVILNQENQVVSSNNETYRSNTKQIELIIKTAEKQGELLNRYLIKNLHGTNYKMIGIIQPEKAFAKSYNEGLIILWTIIIVCIVVGLTATFIGQQTKPLSMLVRKMHKVQEGNLEEFAEITGTEEIQELSRTYNKMLREINTYIEQLLKSEEDKRKAEIHALQMQINPHYIYNTLASIKWLIWQGDANKSTQMIDAFILLLRNTISNTNEFVTVEQEIENLKNYILINQMRYGGAVQAEYYVSEDCKQYQVPKLILQPFVENAFFHGYPEGMQGMIQVFVKKEKECLKFEIADDGVGMDVNTLCSLQRKEGKKSEHFTGIGINNVDNRIKMIYGKKYGIHIVSEKGAGTTVVIKFPAQKE